MTEGVEVSIASLREDARTSVADRLAPEEPLEIQIFGQPFAVLMRTPGRDVDLVTGFLLTERIVASMAEIDSVAHCSIAPTPEAEDNVIQVKLHVPPPARGRTLFASSSCGVCGKATIELAMRLGGPLVAEPRIETRTLYALSDRLRAEQALFSETGGLHGAALFHVSGELLHAGEDVGRHNAVDKSVGAAARAGRALGDAVLLVSGRVSFEIVQKAAAAGVALVAGISAPSSLAVRYGEALGITVIGFLRGNSANVYSHERRVV